MGGSREDHRGRFLLDGGEGMALCQSVVSNSHQGSEQTSFLIFAQTHIPFTPPFHESTQDALPPVLETAKLAAPQGPYPTASSVRLNVYSQASVSM